MNSKIVSRWEWELDRPSLLLLKDKKEIVGVEIGVHFGINAKNILENYDIKLLYLIDPYVVYFDTSGGTVGDQKEYDKIKKFARGYLKGYYNIVWIEEPSDIAVNFVLNDLDFVYIDGDHSYEATKKDIELYYPKVRSGGLVAGHDYKPSEPGVVKAVNEFFKGKKIMYGGRWDWWHIKD